jgi:large subunit ribosomal protein L19
MTEEKNTTPVEETKTEQPQTKPEETKTEEKKVEKNPTNEIYPEIQSGKVVKVHEEITETNPKGEEKKRVQVFEGMVLQRKHGNEVNATITVRKVSNGIGVEKIYPLHSPAVKKIEVIKQYKVRRAKISFIRNYFKKLKEIKK